MSIATLSPSSIMRRFSSRVPKSASRFGVISSFFFIECLSFPSRDRQDSRMIGSQDSLFAHNHVAEEIYNAGVLRDGYNQCGEYPMRVEYLRFPAKSMN